MFEKLEEAIMDTLNGWIEDIINFVLSWINELVFKIPESSFVDDVRDFFIWFTGVFAVVLVLYKIIEYIINTQNGTQDYPFDEILLRAIKSAGAMLVLPWILNVMIFDIALPISNYFTAIGTDFDGEAGYTVLKAFILGGFSGIQNVLLLLFCLFFLVVFLMFLYSVCVFYADIVVMQILIGPVSLSMIADDNNYFQVWWRELLSQVTSLLIKLALLTLCIHLVFTGGNILLAIGAGALIIKSPSVMKNMWYGGGGMRAAARGAGQMASFSSRHLVMQLMKK